MFKRFVKYALVGLQISILYWGMLYCLTEFLHIWYMFSAMITTLTTSFYGFIINSIWTWKGHKQIETSIFRELTRNWKKPSICVRLLWGSRFVRYYMVGTIAILFGWLQVYCYTEYLHIYYMFSSMLGTIVVMTSTFLIRDKWIWKNDDAKTT